MLLSNECAGRKVTAKSTRYAQTHRRQQHHSAVGTGSRGVESLGMMANPPQKKRQAQCKQQVRNKRADQRSPHHVEQTCPKRDYSDNQLRSVAEGGVQQSSDCI